MRCGKPSCGCHAPGGNPHGPYHYVSIKIDDRYVNKYLGRDKLKIKLAGAFRDYVGKIARYRMIQREIDHAFIELRDAGIVSFKEVKKHGTKKR